MSHCPFCRNRINRYNGRHIYSCSKNNKIWKKEDIKYEYLLFNFPNISNKNSIFNEYVIKQSSLPDIKKNFNISYKNIIFLLDYHNIKRRTIKQSSKQISSKKYKKTCISKYGVDNVSKISTIKEKKKNKTHDYSLNIEILKKLHTLFINNTMKLSMNNLDTNVKKDLKKFYKVCYYHWNNLNDEQKDFMMDKIYSSIESKVTNYLDELNISYIKRFMIGKKFFDIKVDNILIDVNSDYWHANPDLYKMNDIMKFPFRNVKARAVWDKDEIKKQIAENYNYKIIYVWESEIKDLNKDDLIEYLNRKIFNI